MSPHAVVFTADHRPDMEAFAPVLAEALGLSLIDARLRIRKGRGVFLEKLDEETARHVADALGAHDAPAEVVPMESLVRLPGRPIRMFQVDCRPDGLRYRRNASEEFRSVPWDAVRFAHAGILATPQYRDFVQSKTFFNLPTMHLIDDPEARERLKRYAAQKALRREADAPALPDEDAKRLSPKEIQDLCRNQTDAHLDLFVDDRPGWLRADRREVVLDYLGPRGGANSLENFKRMVDDVTTHAAQAHVTPITRRLLEGGDLQPLVFDDRAEYERYLGWVCFREGIAPPSGDARAPAADVPIVPEGTEVTACPACGTVIEVGAARCPYCKGSPASGRKRLFWRVAVPLFVLWMCGVGATLVYQESLRREDAINRVRCHVVRSNGPAARTTMDAALQAELEQSGGRRKGIGWGVTRRGPGRYEVEYVIQIKTGGDSRLTFEKVSFLVDLENATIAPLDPIAERFMPAVGQGP